MSAPPRGVPIREHDPDLTEADYAVLARLADEITAARANSDEGRAA